MTKPASPVALMRAARLIPVLTVQRVECAVDLGRALVTGGIAALRALGGPFPGARFCPTGGIAEDRIGAWLDQPNMVAVGGSWLAPMAEVERGAWNAITARAQQAMARLQQHSLSEA